MIHLHQILHFIRIDGGFDEDESSKEGCSINIKRGNMSLMDLNPSAQRLNNREELAQG